jgi:hypothetical protein
MIPYLRSAEATKRLGPAGAWRRMSEPRELFYQIINEVAFKQIEY